MSRDATSPPDPVLVELAEQHFTGNARAIFMALPFAAVSVWLMRESLPAWLLLAWFFAFGLTVASRYATVVAFCARRPPTRASCACA